MSVIFIAVVIVEYKIDGKRFVCVMFMISLWTGAWTGLLLYYFPR